MPYKNLARPAGICLLTILALMGLFHLLIMGDIIPSSIVWGNRIQNHHALMLMEGAALFVTGCFAGLVWGKIRFNQKQKKSKVITTLLWIFFIYLLLNTIGNLASKQLTETLIFTPITLLMAGCTYLLVKS